MNAQKATKILWKGGGGGVDVNTHICTENGHTTPRIFLLTSLSPISYSNIRDNDETHIECHQGLYRSGAYSRVRNALIYYVDDVSVGTKIIEVRAYIKRRYDITITQKLMRDVCVCVCIHAKDYSRLDITSPLLEDGKSASNRRVA